MEKHHVGFISTRLNGMDGVSLETRKWAQIFEEEGFSCFFMAGELDHPAERSFLVEEAHFTHPDIVALQNACFGIQTRDPAITRRLHEMKELLKARLYEFIRTFELDLLIPENVLAIPMNLPLGLALTEVISETGIQTIAHHHDMFWERKRFLTNGVWEYLNMAFPPHLPTIQHVVINSSASNQLSLRSGISATLIPNIMDFETPPPPIDDYAADVRDAFGLEKDEYFILQPTRVVQRKGIEHAIELVSHLDLKARLVISHASGDEGYGYEKRVRDYSKSLGVQTLFICHIIDDSRGVTAGGKKIYSLEDVYPHADLVTYPSTFEGFGNAFLEAIHHRKPLVVNNYSIYSFDIKPKGFKVIEFDGYITDETVNQTREVLSNRELCHAMVEHNYRLALKHYSCSVLRQKLRYLLLNCFGR
jgi:glycosyltransferase involved in cell wall biosynthesis